MFGFNVMKPVPSQPVGRPRVTTITVLGLGIALFLLSWSAPVSAQVDFTWDPESPDISETVTFTIGDASITPISWDFGGPDCLGNEAVLDCQWIPEYCRNITWSYAEPGSKTVHLVTDQGEVQHTFEVQDSGSCCSKDGMPRAAFTLSPNPAFVGQQVSFTDLSSKGSVDLPAKDTVISFTFEPVNPEIGDLVMFSIDGVDAVDSAEWNFGGEGCGEFVPENICTPLYINCLEYSYIYAGAGEKTVRLTINGGLYETTETLTVQNEGQCFETGPCNYLTSPATNDFGPAGGYTDLAVSTGPECSWTATTDAPWLNIISGESGTGNGTVVYGVAANTGPARTGHVRVEGRVHTVFQEAVDEGNPGDTAPTSWEWTITADGVNFITSDQPSFDHVFETPGLYSVRLEATNCLGTDFEIAILVIEEPPASADGWVVPSAVHAPGLNQTRWRTDLWIFNPGLTALDLAVEFLPEDTDNWLVDHPTLELTIPAQGTAALEDVLVLIPGVVENNQAVIGSVLINRPEDDQQPVPVITSRTFNQQATGSFGQFVPAASVPPNASDRLFMTGLSHTSESRTNIRLANLGTEAVEVTLFVLSADGHWLGQPVYRTIEALSTTQINGIAEEAWAGTDLEVFSVRVDTDVDSVLAWASVVDNLTGDPVLFDGFAANPASRTLWVPGVAHLPGANNSQWRSDITLFNPAVFPLDTELNYFPSEEMTPPPALEVINLQPAKALFYPDVLASDFLAPGDESKGYFVISGTGHEPPLAAAARSYNLDPAGGTFGQNLSVFDGADWISPGGRAFIPGVTLSSATDVGFRTNIGMLNVDPDTWAEIALTLLDSQGNVTGQLSSFWLAGGELSQFNLASRLGLSDIELVGTVIIEHLGGGPIVAYASVIDNRTQDPILIPAAPETP